MRILNRAEAKKFLSEKYPDYNPTRHDAFVIRYEKELSEQALARYHTRRGLNNSDNEYDPLRLPLI